MVIGGNAAGEWAICGFCAFNVVGCDDILRLLFNLIFCAFGLGMLMNAASGSLLLLSSSMPWITDKQFSLVSFFLFVSQENELK